MKYLGTVFFVGFLMYGSIVFGNEYFSNIERNHNFNSPLKTSEKIINSHGNVNVIYNYVRNDKKLTDRLVKIFSQSINSDFSNTFQMRICTYKDRKKGNLVIAKFDKNNNRWVLKGVYDKKNKRLSTKKIKKKSYHLDDAIGCFSSFVTQWDKSHKESKLLLVNREAKINNIFVGINKQPHIATFNFQYIHPNKIDKLYKNGWLVSSVHLDKINKKYIVNKPIPPSEQSYFASEVLTPAQMQAATIRKPNREQPIIQEAEPVQLKNKAVDTPPIVNSIICHDDGKMIRLVFNMFNTVDVQSRIRSSKGNKHLTFSIDIRTTKIKPNNCSFLKTFYESGLTVIDLTKFPKNIIGVQYGSGRDYYTSFIDYYY